DAGAAGLGRAAAGLDCPFLEGAGSSSLADWGLRAVVASGLSADRCSQYCSSVSLSQSMLGQSSSSRFRCWRERPFEALCPLADLRRESERSWPGPVFGAADLPRPRIAGVSPEGKSA